MPKAYYNEIDPKAAAWLRELIKCGLIAAGDVDERSIHDVQPTDLVGYTQCHFFAGIGGWSLALRLAGWPDDGPVWTGSCPCQPFSCAGKGKGTADSRHLWPEFARLIRAGRPETIYGEQVASAEVVGTELEASFLVAVQQGQFSRANKLAKRLAQSRTFHYSPRWVDGVRADLEAAGYALRFTVLGAHSVGSPHIRKRLYWMGHPFSVRRSTPWVSGASSQAIPAPKRQKAGAAGSCIPPFWQEHKTIRCLDGNARRIPLEPEFHPLAHGIPARVVPGGDNGAPIPQSTTEARVMRLKGYGNAIVAQLAAEFIQACEEAIQEVGTL